MVVWRRRGGIEREREEKEKEKGVGKKEGGERERGKRKGKEKGGVVSFGWLPTWVYSYLQPPQVSRFQRWSSAGRKGCVKE